MQGYCVAVLIWTSDVVKEKSVFSIAFWISTAMTLFYYICAAYSNPGYILGSSVMNMSTIPNMDMLKKEQNFDTQSALPPGSYPKKLGHQRKVSVL